VLTNKQHDAPQQIRVFLVVGHSILLWGLQQLFRNNASGIVLVGSAANSDDALLALNMTPADVILLDLDEKHMLNAIPLLMAESQARVLALTRQDDKPVEDRAILNGARGILKKNATADLFLQAIIKVHHGQLWLDRAATGRIFVEFSRRESTKTAAQEQPRISALTEREKKIFACIFENPGDSAKTIANKLHISESTLRNHLTSIYGKMGVSNRFELISYALRNSPLLAFS
jgi:two-component system nitrate/nitrite response regulator NarL